VPPHRGTRKQHFTTTAAMTRRMMTAGTVIVQTAGTGTEAGTGEGIGGVTIKEERRTATDDNETGAGAGGGRRVGGEGGVGAVALHVVALVLHPLVGS